MAPRFAKVSLELGGKNATLVLGDADLDEAVPGALRAAFENSGQICLCGPRILVDAAVYDRFVERFAAAAAALRVGDPVDEATEQGALVSRAHLDKVLSYVELARDEGGRIVTGGTRPDVGRALPGRLLPVAHRVAERLDSGIVWVNTWLSRDLRVPFGGMKQSGVGREGGEGALRFFAEAKTVTVATASWTGRPRASAPRRRSGPTHMPAEWATSLPVRHRPTGPWSA